MKLNRRHFLKAAASAASISAAAADAQEPRPGSKRAAGKSYAPNRIVNDYSRFLPGEREALSEVLSCKDFGNGTVLVTAGKTTQTLAPGGAAHGWNLKAIFSMNGTDTAVFEKQATHAGATADIYDTLSPGNRPQQKGAEAVAVWTKKDRVGSCGWVGRVYEHELAG